MDKHNESTFGAEYLQDVVASEFGCGCGDAMRANRNLVEDLGGGWYRTADGLIVEG